MTVLNVTRRVMMAATAATLTLGAPVFAGGHQVVESIHFLIPGGAGGGWDGTARGTGEALTGPIPVDLTFRALGGARAIAAERQGIFQRDRIQSQIIGWARQEFGLDVQGTQYTF